MSSEKIKGCVRHPGRFITLALLFVLLAFWGMPGKAAARFTGGLFSVREVSAAPEKSSEGEIIPFTNKSGRFLKYINGQFYLFNKKGTARTGVQYLTIPAAHGISSGFYMFDEKGRLLQQNAVYHLKNQKAGSRVFNGYYYTSASGRFVKSTQGLRYLKGFSCGKKTFQGYYYVKAYGKLSGTAGIRYLAPQRVWGRSFAANYYYFDSMGRLCTAADFHRVSQKLGGHTFKGNYCFSAANGGLYMKAGWRTVGGKTYYLSGYGRRYENCWKEGYYLLSDGTIARSMQVADGSYVDCDGRRCSKEEMVLSPLKKELQQMLSSLSGTWSVYVKDLKTGDVVNINETSMYPASTIKAFVMASTYDQIYQGRLSFSSTVRSLLKSMITVSDNEAYNQLVRYNSPDRSFVSGAAAVNQYLAKNGYVNTACHSSLHPAWSSPVSDGGTNKASARDCGLLLERIYRGTCVSAAYSGEMLNLLLQQTRRWKIPAALPAGTKVANKTGETSSYQHDIAIVYGPKTTYVLCIFSRTSEYNGINGIKNITRKVHSYLN